MFLICLLQVVFWWCLPWFGARQLWSRSCPSSWGGIPPSNTSNTISATQESAPSKWTNCTQWYHLVWVSGFRGSSWSTCTIVYTERPTDKNACCIGKYTTDKYNYISYYYYYHYYYYYYSINSLYSFSISISFYLSNNWILIFDFLYLLEFDFRLSKVSWNWITFIVIVNFRD